VNTAMEQVDCLGSERHDLTRPETREAGESDQKPTLRVARTAACQISSKHAVSDINPERTAPGQERFVIGVTGLVTLC